MANGFNKFMFLLACIGLFFVGKFFLFDNIQHNNYYCAMDINSTCGKLTNADAYYKCAHTLDWQYNGIKYSCGDQLDSENYGDIDYKYKIDYAIKEGP